MRPNRATAHFDRSSLQLLASVIGTSWRFATGTPLAQRPGSLIAVGQTFVATDACQLDIRSELDVLRFEGFDEDYPRLVVGSAERSALEGARRSGRLTFRGRGETVEHVYIVREEITSLRNEEVQWVYSSDIALVFELSRCFVGIAKAGHHDEVMFVSFGASVDELDLPDRTIEWDWDNEIGQEYRTSREFLDILDCLEGSGGGAPPGGHTP